MYGWFNRATGGPDPQVEPPLTIEKDADLTCTPHGQVAELSSRTVFSFTAEKSRNLKRQRMTLNGDELKRVVVATLKLPAREGIPDYRILRPIANRRYPTRFATTYAVESEPGVFAVVTRLQQQSHLSRPHSSDAELRDEPLVRELLEGQSGVPFFACDVRGIGDSRPDTCGVDQFLKPYGNDYFYAAHGIMLDRPYLGQKTHDVLRVLDWLADIGHRGIHLAGCGWGALPAALAALLSEQVEQVTLKHGLHSYENIAESEGYDWPLSALLPDVLVRFDLPDVYRALEAKRLRQLDFRGAT
jgi:hypothetical protein